MNLLVFLPYIPWPLDRGTYQRSYHLVRELAKYHTVDLLALGENGEGLEHHDQFASFCREVEFIPFEHPPWKSIFSGRLFNPLPSNVLHWQSPEVAAIFDRRLRERDYDLVHLCDLVLAPYMLPHLGRLPFVVDRSRVDLQFQLMEHRAMKFSWRARLLRFENYAKLWRLERQVARLAVLEVVCGPDDETFIRRHIRREASVMVMANGVNLDFFRPDAVPDTELPRPTVVFCGAMDYNPNIDALNWYFTEIHAAVLAAVPELEVLIVGKNPVPAVRALGEKPGVTVTGSVPDVRPWYRRSWLQMVPLRIGGGTRLKIVESLAMSTPVVSTTIGAQGLDLEHGRDILLGDTPAGFAAEMIRGLTDPELRRNLREAGLHTARSRFGWPAIIEPLARRYGELPSSPGGGRTV